LQRNTKVNIHHLQKRMEQSGRWNPEEQLTFAKMKKLLLERFESIDYDSAREDVARFLSNGDRSNLSLWNADFFIDITKRSLCE
jgi:hypothetical protein